MEMQEFLFFCFFLLAFSMGIFNMVFATLHGLKEQKVMVYYIWNHLFLLHLLCNMVYHTSVKYIYNYVPDFQDKPKTK